MAKSATFVLLVISTWAQSIGALQARRSPQEADTAPYPHVENVAAPPYPLAVVEQTGARIRVGQSVRVFAGGASNVAWNTWVDQFSLLMHQLGYDVNKSSGPHQKGLETAPEQSPVCDDHSSILAHPTPRITCIGWASWGFSYENKSDCVNGWRTIAGFNVSCQNAWACNPDWEGPCGAMVPLSKLAAAAADADVALLSTWINDVKQEYGNNNACFSPPTVAPIDAVQIAVVDLRKQIQAIHALNPHTTVAVLAIYPERGGDGPNMTLPLWDTWATQQSFNKALQKGLDYEPNTVWINYSFPFGVEMFQTMASGHPNCRGDKVLAKAAIDALFRAKVIERGLAFGANSTCLARHDCAELSTSCCQTAAQCWVSSTGACVPYSPGKQ